MGNKMRLYKYICVFIAIIAFLTGCVNLGTENLIDGMQMISETESGGEGFQTVNLLLEENCTYTIEMATYQYKNAYIEYPRIQGLGDKKREEKINSLIENYLLLIIMNDDLPGADYTEAWEQFEIKLECRVTLQTRELLSFYYAGEARWYEDDPRQKFHSMTLDLINVKELLLSDFVDIDGMLVDRIKGATDILDPQYGETVDLDIIQKRPAETYIEKLSGGLPGFEPSGVFRFSEGGCGFVLEPDALVIEAAGDTYRDSVCILVRIPGRISGNRFVFDEN